ncbi:uncharacterized protein [Nicotiana tomentosiformis]|uniref:uncharacterized protein n=1 Tax=Nicotiana tomentosiformis TaxID=4098 RepID=UPI00388CC931
MADAEHRRLERFERLQPLPFSGTESEDAQDFLDRCQRMLRTAGGQFYRSRGCSYRHAQTSRSVHSSVSSNHGSYSSPQSQSSLSALPAPITLHTLSVQGSYVPDPSGNHSGSRGPPQNSPPFFEMECYECGELGHVRKYCPHRTRGTVQQSRQATTSVPVAPPPTPSAQGGAQSARGRPRGGGRSGGGQGRFYAFPARPNIVASDAVITGIVSVCHREASILFDPGFIIFCSFMDMPYESLVHLFMYLRRCVIL